MSILLILSLYYKHSDWHMVCTQYIFAKSVQNKRMNESRLLSVIMSLWFSILLFYYMNLQLFSATILSKLYFKHTQVLFSTAAYCIVCPSLAFNLLGTVPFPVLDCVRQSAYSLWYLLKNALYPSGAEAVQWLHQPHFLSFWAHSWMTCPPTMCP